MSYIITANKYLLPSELEATRKIINNTNERDAVLLSVALATGGRRCEVLEALNTPSALLNDESIFLRGLKDSHDRAIPITSELYARIKSLLKRDPSAFAISTRRFNQIWDHHRPVSKPLHCLRHTFAIELYRKSRDIQLVASALGHKNIANTMVYMQLVHSAESLRKALL